MQLLKRVQSALFGSRALSVKLDSLNLLKRTLSTQYLSRVGELNIVEGDRLRDCLELIWSAC
jgi:hypothetical protein